MTNEKKMFFNWYLKDLKWVSSTYSIFFFPWMYDQHYDLKKMVIDGQLTRIEINDTKMKNKIEFDNNTL